MFDGYYWVVIWLGKGKQRYETFNNEDAARRFAYRLETDGCCIHRIPNAYSIREFLREAH